VPAVAERLADLRQEHGDVFRAQAHRVAKRHGVPRQRASLAVLLALGSLSNLHSWYDPKGPLGLEELAEMVADQLLQPFLGAEAPGLHRQ
jgi:hypothetical protein